MRSMLAIAFALLCVTAACSGGGGDAAPAPPPTPTPQILPLSLDVSGRAVIKMRARAAGVVLLEETLSPLTAPGPVRTLEIVDGNGNIAARFDPPAGWALIDFAVHPSGEISVAIATQRDVRLLRLDGMAATRIDTTIADAQAATDPFFDDGGLHDDASLLPVYTRDAVRIAALGEDLAVALRTGRNATIAYRFRVSGASYANVWRTLVEPGLSVFAIGITSGSFDTFGQLANHWKVHLDTAASGAIAVAVPSRSISAPVFARHAQFFHEPIAATEGALVTQLAPDGQRIATTAIDTTRASELHGVTIGPEGVVLVGRVFTEQRGDGNGWDAWFARIAQSDARVAAYRVVDVDRGDVLFDAQPLPQGRYLAAGATGYTENPNGASIDEHADPLLLVLGPDGGVVKRIAFSAGPRQNQLLSLAVRGDAWSVAGLVDGPGTHSGDGNPGVIRANGLVRPLDPATP